MEDNFFITETPDNLYISKESADLLVIITKWTKFLSIFGFIIIALMLIGIISSGVLLSNMNTYATQTAMYPYTPGTFMWGYAIPYIILLIIYFFPMYFLYKFSVRTKEALQTRNAATLADSLRFLKNHYMMIGIIAIITIVSFIIMFMRLAFMMM